MEVTSEQIRETYEEYKTLLSKAVSKYRGMISSDEIENCKLHAVYKSLLNFDPSKNTKFGSFLCNNVRWEIFSIIRKDDVYYRKHTGKYSDMAYQHDFDTNDIFLDIEKEETREIVRDRLIGRMSYQDLAKKHNMCKETARKNFLAFLEDFKEKSV